MLPALVCTALALALAWVIVSFWRKAYNLPPGPTGLPFLGYYPFLSDKPYQDFAKLAVKYGDVISFRTIGGHLIVVLNGLDTIREVLVNRADEFIGRPRETHQVVWISDGKGPTQEEGEVWKEHRWFFSQTAKNFGFGKADSEPLIHEEVGTLLADIKAMAGEALDLKFHVYYAVSSVASQLLLSRKFEKNEPLVRKITSAATYLVDIFMDKRFMVVGLPFKLMLMLPSTERNRKAKRFFKSLSEEITEEHIKTFDPDNPRDYMDAYLNEAQKLAKSGKLDHTFTRDRLSSTSSNLLLESTETAGGTIIGLLDVAAKYPSEQNLVRAELDAVIGRERLLSWSDRPNVPYLEAFIQELYRNKLTCNTSTMYSNFRETTIHNCRIPERSVIVANYYSISQDPTLFPDPTKFDPKRFLDESGKRKKTEGLYPFGLGKRSCIGESLARMEVFIVIGSILQNFTLHSTEESGKYRIETR